MTERVFNSGSEKARYYRELKKQKEKERQLIKYHANKEQYNARKRQTTLNNKSETKISKNTKRMRLYRKRKAEEKTKAEKNGKERNEKKRDYRKRCKIRQQDFDCDENLDESFNSRTQKHRALKKLKENLPSTPRKRAALLSSYLNSKASPTVTLIKKINKVPSPEDLKNVEMAEAVLSDIKTIVSDTKLKRSDDARATLNIMSAAVNGTNVETKRCRIQLSKKLGFTSKRMTKGKRFRTKVSTCENSAWTYTSRKTRSDALSEEAKKQIYDFWISPDNSRPTGNKNDLKRVRLGPKQYSTHMKYILEKTQTEVYLDFKENFPHIKVSQRLFEKLKPYFVIPARPCDRETCCCRYHVEARYLFKSAMDFRKKFTPPNDPRYPVFDHLTDITNATLCQKDDNQNFHNLKCVESRCEQCGVDKLIFSEQELATNNEATDVEWMRYEYVSVKTKGAMKKKLCLVKKKTKPGVLFQYFKDILSKFSSHVFRSKWQSNQLKYLKENLSLNDIICIHDFSENYACKDRIEIQSSYFQKTEVSLHVSIIYRHPVEGIDDMTNLDPDSGLVEEHFFVLSPDLIHDHHHTHAVQEQINLYLKDINYYVETVHEFTDGCASQYKSRHCFGDISFAKNDFNWNLVRNYFETSHAKGVQDSAGGLIKNQADYAVARGKVIIQNAKDLYMFCIENLETPKQT